MLTLSNCWQIVRGWDMGVATPTFGAGQLSLKGNVFSEESSVPSFSVSVEFHSH